MSNCGETRLASPFPEHITCARQRRSSGALSQKLHHAPASARRRLTRRRPLCRCTLPCVYDEVVSNACVPLSQTQSLTPRRQPCRRPAPPCTARQQRRKAVVFLYSYHHRAQRRDKTCMPRVAKPLHECVSPRRDKLCQVAYECGCLLKRRNEGLMQGKRSDRRHSNGEFVQGRCGG